MKISIYKLYADATNRNDTNESEPIYVGSTKLNLEKRLEYHIKNANQPEIYKSKLYKYMNLIGIEKFKIKEIHTTDVDNHTEQRKIEQEWLNKLSPSLNTNKAYLTPEEKRRNRDKWFKWKYNR